MRAFITVMIALGVAGLAVAQDLPPTSAAGPSPFPVEPGTAPPPPAEFASVGRTPPEGTGPAGLDFGQWRGAGQAYASDFQAQIARRFDGRGSADIRADLEANGFACAEGERLECRIELVEGDCAFDWYVVLERRQPAPVAGFYNVCGQRG